MFATALETNQQLRHQRTRWVIQSGQVEVALKTILDSQAYDDEIVSLEIERVAGVVAGTPHDERDDKWLHIFRQLAMTLRDRTLVVGEVMGQVSDSLASFFRRVVGDESAGFQELFLSYIRLDAAGALEMAHSMRIDTAMEYPHVLIKALDEPAMLAHALAEFSRGGSDTRKWASILGIGALYQRSVAIRLAAISGEESVSREIIQQSTRRRGWHKCWKMRGTLLGIVFEAACRWPASSRLLEIMSQLPIRTSRKLDRLYEIPVLAWFLILLLIPFPLIFLTLLKTAPLTIDEGLAIGLGLAVIYATFWLVALTRVGRPFGAEWILPSRLDQSPVSYMSSAFASDSPYFQYIIDGSVTKIRAPRAIYVNYLSERHRSRSIISMTNCSFNMKFRIFASLASSLASVEVGDHVER